MALTQTEVNAIYADYKRFMVGKTVYDLNGSEESKKIVKTIEEVGKIDCSMLEEASRVYMLSIGQGDEIDHDLLLVDGAI